MKTLRFDKFGERIYSEEEYKIIEPIIKYCRVTTIGGSRDGDYIFELGKMFVDLNFDLDDELKKMENKYEA